VLVSETVNYGKDAVAEIAFFAERIVRSLATGVATGDSLHK